MLCALYNCFSVPIKVVFQPPVMYQGIPSVIDQVIDILFSFDILIGFRMAYYDHKGDEHTTSRMMALNYIKNEFIIDLLATFPFDLIVQMDSSNKRHWTQIFQIMKLNRLLRFRKIVQYMRAVIVIKGFLHILKIILFLFIYLHCFACFWFMAVEYNMVWFNRIDVFNEDR